MRIGHIAGCKHARQLGTRCTRLGQDIAYFVCIQIGLENLRIGFMTDSQEESVNGTVVTFFIGLSHAFYQVHTFYAIFAVQTYRIVLEEYFYFSLFITRSCMILEARRKGLRTIR